MALITIVHIVLAIILFFTVNLLGQHSPSSLGYYQLTTFLETEEAPAFNFVIRVLTPAVYLILLSTLFYSVGLDKLTVSIYLVSVYYVLFRTFFNILINRSILINWKKHLFYSLSIVGLCYFIYVKFIRTKANILPDFSNMSNELWIIIIIFLYNFINNIQPSDKSAQKRKEKYIDSQFERINAKYGQIIISEIAVHRLRHLAFAIIIYEDFNRPKLFRIIERLKFLLTKKPHTLGIMQVMTNKNINDKESVKLGINKLNGDFNNLKLEYLSDQEMPGTNEWKDDLYQKKLVEKYNPSIAYSFEVIELANELRIKYFGNESIRLFNDEKTDLSEI